MYNAIAMGSSFFELCKSSAPGVIHSIFEKTINVSVESYPLDPIYTLSRSDVDISPAMLVTSMLPGESWQHLGLGIGDRVTLTIGTVYCRRRPIIGNLAGASVWQTSSHRTLSLLPKLSGAEILSRCQTALGMVKNSKKGTLYYNAFLTRFSEGMRALQCAMASENSADFDWVVKKLIGFGEGLTPSGDDFLAGVLSAIHFIQKKDSASSKALPHLIAAIEGNIQRTNQISGHFLRYAAAGLWGLSTERFLTALFREQDDDLQHAINKKLSHGETSGMDEIFGILFGLRETFRKDEMI